MIISPNLKKPKQAKVKRNRKKPGPGIGGACIVNNPFLTKKWAGIEP